MKKFLKVGLVVGLLILGNVGFSQIKQVDIEEPTVIGKTGTIECRKLNDVYTFLYEDLNFTQLTKYRSFQFKDENNAFDDFYNIIMDGFINVPNDTINIEMPDQLVSLKYIKTMGIVNLTILSQEHGVTGRSEYLTKRKVNKLFGKK